MDLLGFQIVEPLWFAQLQLQGRLILFFSVYISSVPELTYPEDKNIAVVPITLTWNDISLGKACNTTEQAAIYLYISIPVYDEDEEYDEDDIVLFLAATLSVEATYWTLPESYSEG